MFSRAYPGVPELPSPYPLSPISSPPPIHSPQPISVVEHQYSYYSPNPHQQQEQEQEYHSPPPANPQTSSNTTHQGYTSVPVAGTATYDTGDYDTEKATPREKSKISIFGKQYTKKTLILTGILTFIILAIIIGLGAGLGAKSSKKGGKKTKGLGGGVTGLDTQNDGSGIDTTLTGGLGDDTTSTGGDDLNTTTAPDNPECTSCDCTTDFALLQKCVEAQHDMTMDVLNNWS